MGGDPPRDISTREGQGGTGGEGEVVVVVSPLSRPNPVYDPDGTVVYFLSIQCRQTQGG